MSSGCCTSTSIAVSAMAKPSQQFKPSNRPPWDQEMHGGEAVVMALFSYGQQFKRDLSPTLVQIPALEARSTGAVLNVMPF